MQPETRVTILRKQNRLVIDGTPTQVDCSTLDDTIHAVQWEVSEQQGQVEYADGKRNLTIDSIADYSDLITAACESIEAAQLAAEAAAQAAEESTETTTE